MDVFVSWSGGKDCCLACYRAMTDGLEVKYLASMITKRFGRLYPHHFTPEILKMQAEAMGVPMVQQWTTVSEYNDKFIKMLKKFKKEDISGGVFGDVSIGNNDAEEHRQWIESVCKPVDINVHLPLWDEDRESLLLDLIDSGFEAIIIAADNERLGKDWLGRKLDRKLLDELKERHKNSADGKVGYYHTLVVDGPIFKKRIEIIDTDILFKEPFWYLDIIRSDLKDKAELKEKNEQWLVNGFRYLDFYHKYPQKALVDRT